MTVIKWALFTIPAIIGLTACQTDGYFAGDGDMMDLPGTTWGPAGDNPFDQYVEFTSDTELSGYAGCNRFFGSYSRNGDRLEISPLGATRMACPGGRIPAEQDFLSRLQQAKAVSGDGSKIELSDDNGMVILVLNRRNQP